MTQLQQLQALLPIRFWSPGDSIPVRGQRILIGLAPWSAIDRLLLTPIIQQATDLKSSLAVDVFNVDGLSEEALEAYIPGMGKVHHTPVVGVWENGTLTQSATGFNGRKLLFQFLQLDPIRMQNSFFKRVSGQ